MTNHRHNWDDGRCTGWLKFYVNEQSVMTKCKAKQSNLIGFKSLVIAAVVATLTVWALWFLTWVSR